MTSSPTYFWKILATEFTCKNFIRKLSQKIEKLKTIKGLKIKPTVSETFKYFHSYIFAAKA